MKHIRLAGVMLALALCLGSVVFTSNAVAAKVCSTAGTGAACASGHGSELTTQAFTAHTVSSTLWIFTSGFITVDCESHESGEFTHAGVAKVTFWSLLCVNSSLGSCSSASTNASAAAPYSVTTAATGSGNGAETITASPITMTFTCAGITCKYTTTEMGGGNGSIAVTGSDTAPNLTFSSIGLTKEGGSSGFCSSTATVEGTSKFSSPTSLWIE